MKKWWIVVAIISLGFAAQAADKVKAEKKAHEAVKPAAREKVISVPDQQCEYMKAGEESQSADYKPGVDVKGKPVKSADVEEPVIKPPEPGDYAFREPTKIGPIALTLWAANPNMQCFWLLDAVTQNTRVPTPHLGLIAIYGVLEIGAFLALGVVLFQGRDVG